MNPATDIFVSYAATDAARAAKITDELEKRGFAVWKDRNIAPGSVWTDEVLRQIEAAKNVLVLLSDQSSNSEAVTTETAVALADHKTVVPVLLSKHPGIPFLLRDRQWVDLSDPNTYQQNLDVLAEALRTTTRVTQEDTDVRARMLGNVQAALEAEIKSRAAENEFKESQLVSQFAGGITTLGGLAFALFFIIRFLVGEPNQTDTKVWFIAICAGVLGLFSRSAVNVLAAKILSLRTAHRSTKTGK